MSIVQKIRNAWRKNGPELLGLLNGGLPPFFLARAPKLPLNGIPVFCYHLVSAEQFEADLSFLARNAYTTIDADHFADCLTGARPVPERAVLLTFDDGPRNFHDVAFPLLRKYGAKATAFIASGMHADSYGDADPLDDRLMTWGEIATINASGLVGFQSHTLESRYLPSWPMAVSLSGVRPRLEDMLRKAPLGIDADLRQSRAMIESRLPDTRVTHLCFPMYDGTDEAIAIARDAGFRACYWGILPGAGVNSVGRSPYYTARISGEFVRRLPGTGRISLADWFRNRIDRARAASSERARHSQGTGAS